METSIKDIVIIGSGGFAKEIAFLIEEINRIEKKWNLLGFVDEGEGKVGDYNIIGDDNWLINYINPLNVVIGIGNPNTISKVFTKINKNHNLSFPNLVHPNVIADWNNLSMQHGNLICASNIFTTNINIGSFNIFNLNCTLGHDSVIGDFNIFNPGVNISGGVKIEDLNLFGTNSTILQYLNINSGNTIGASSVINKSIVHSGTYVGVPGKKIK